MATVHPWPELREKDRWLIDLMEELLEDPAHPPEELRERARELRADVDEQGAFGRDAALALADRYELAAAARTRRLDGWQA